MSSKIHYVRTPLDRDEIAAVNRMLKAAGEVLVTRAMMNTCRPKYKNAGWDNCWFTQMFGGKANLNRMTDVVHGTSGNRRSRPRLSARVCCRRQARYQSVSDVNTVISLFDRHSRHPIDWGLRQRVQRHLRQHHGHPREGCHLPGDRRSLVGEAWYRPDPGHVRGTQGRR
jgi:hypothetical protein